MDDLILRARAARPPSLGEHEPVNIGNPDHEVTMLELAETVIRVTV